MDRDDVGAGEQLLHRHRLRVQLAWAVPLFLAGIDAEDSNAARDIPHMDTLYFKTGRGAAERRGAARDRLRSLARGESVIK